jgi:NAD(P) transhydrogenase subunit beta
VPTLGGTLGFNSDRVNRNSKGNRRWRTPRRRRTGERGQKFIKLGFDVAVEAGAGQEAKFHDALYEEAGATVLSASDVWAKADIILKVRPPQDDEVELAREGATLISFIQPAQNGDLLERLAKRKVNAIAMDAVPRISRAQSMDEVNEDLPETDLVVVVGANDIVNPSALEDTDSPIAGMPVIEAWNARTVVALKRSMAAGYSGVENPLYFRENTRMLFGDAKETLTAVSENLG